jgi:L-threonine kinase
MSHALERWRSARPAALPLELSATAMAPATAGELVQGYLDGHDFLIHSPIDLYARASVRISLRERAAPAGVAPPACSVVGESACGVTLDAGPFWKVSQLVSRMAASSRLRHRVAHVEVRIHSPIPRGKGLASSTADLTAAAVALRRALGSARPGAGLGRLLCAVEPSDLVHYRGINLVDQLRGRRLLHLGAAPPLGVILIDCLPKRTVETVAFDRAAARAHAERHAPALRRALALVSDGCRLGDARLVADGATVSAEVNQRLMPKPGFAALTGLIGQGALGICCAHTGTALGLLYDRRAPVGPLLARTRARLDRDGLRLLGLFRLVDGGVMERGDV